jgi:hypothetical protein
MLPFRSMSLLLVVWVIPVAQERMNVSSLVDSERWDVSSRSGV